MILNVNPDICCLCETHLSSINTIEVDGFHFVQHNRSSKHIKARKCSGGVGMLVNNKILQDFKFSVLDMSFEGILSVNFCHKFTDFSFIVICCYLPPQNSVWGRDSDKFFHI